MRRSSIALVMMLAAAAAGREPPPLAAHCGSRLVAAAINLQTNRRGLQLLLLSQLLRLAAGSSSEWAHRSTAGIAPGCSIPRVAASSLSEASFRSTYFAKKP